MNECYAAALSANTTTVVALFVGTVLGLVLMKVDDPSRSQAHRQAHG